MVVGGEQSDSLSLSCGISRFGAGISKCTGSGEGLDTKGSSSKAKESLADFVGVSVGDSPRNTRRTNVRISIFLTSYSGQHPPSPTLFSLWFLYNLIAKYLYKCHMGENKACSCFCRPPGEDVEKLIVQNVYFVYQRMASCPGIESGPHSGRRVLSLLRHPVFLVNTNSTSDQVLRLLV